MLSSWRICPGVWRVMSSIQSQRFMSIRVRNTVKPVPLITTNAVMRLRKPNNPTISQKCARERSEHCQLMHAKGGEMGQSRSFENSPNKIERSSD